MGGPGASQNPGKIAKNRKKTLKNRYRKNACFSTQFFYDFSPFWPPKTEPKSMLFCYFLRNRRFCENALKHWLCAQKSRFELEKNKKKSPKNRFPNVLEKNIAKNLSKFDFYHHLGPM